MCPQKIILVSKSGLDDRLRWTWLVKRETLCINPWGDQQWANQPECYTEQMQILLGSHGGYHNLDFGSPARFSASCSFLWTHHWDILSKPPKGSFVCLCTWSHGTSIVAWWCLRDVRLGKPTLDHRATVRPEELAGMWDERFAGTCAKDFCRSMLSISHQQLCQNPEFYYRGTKLQSSIFLLENKIWSLDAFSLFRGCLWIMNPKVKSFAATISNLWGCGRFIISGPWVQWPGFCKWDGMDPRAGHVLKFSFVGTWDVNSDCPHFIPLSRDQTPWVRFMRTNSWVFWPGWDLPLWTSLEEANQSKTPQEQDPSNDATADEVLVIDRVGHLEVLLGFVWAFETFSNHHFSIISLVCLMIIPGQTFTTMLKLLSAFHNISLYSRAMNFEVLTPVFGYCGYQLVWLRTKKALKHFINWISHKAQQLEKPDPRISLLKALALVMLPFLTFKAHFTVKLSRLKRALWMKTSIAMLSRLPGWNFRERMEKIESIWDLLSAFPNSTALSSL